MTPYQKRLLFAAAWVLWCLISRSILWLVFALIYLIMVLAAEADHQKWRRRRNGG